MPGAAAAVTASFPAWHMPRESQMRGDCTKL